MSAVDERLAALEARVAMLEAARVKSDPFPPRTANARWLTALKFAHPGQKCATTRCGSPIVAGMRAYYVPKGNEGAGVYCVSCGEVMAPTRAVA